MKNRKNQQKIGKMLLKNSLSPDGLIDAHKVQLILREVTLLKPPQLISILKIYHKLVSSYLAKEELIVETAQKITNQKNFEQNILTKTGAKRINYKLNPDIILGAKITHGDWVYDESLSVKLAQLTITE